MNVSLERQVGATSDARRRVGQTSPRLGRGNNGEQRKRPRRRSPHRAAPTRPVSLVVWLRLRRAASLWSRFQTPKRVAAILVWLRLCRALRKCETVFMPRLRFVLLALILASASMAQPREHNPDLTKEPTLYVVGYAHLDTQWRWEYPQTLSEILPPTIHDKNPLPPKDPHHVFNISGANPHPLMKEEYTAAHQRLDED